MRNYNKLKEKFHNDIDEAKKDVGNLNKIADESKRVSEVARDVNIIIQDLDRQFEKATKLNKVDITFLFFATALQCARQYLLTSFPERKNDKDAGKEAHKQEEKVFDKFFNDVEDTTKGSRHYYASLEKIINDNSVPYDAIFGTKKYDLGGSPNKGLDGNTHRLRTLGHDPILGWVFGTSNIMTNTLTAWNTSTYHVVKKPISNGTLRDCTDQKADTVKMFDNVYNRSLEQPTILAASIIKQYFHLKSDVNSTNSLPLPIISYVLSPETAKKLSDCRIDMGNVGTVIKQASAAIFINMLISMIHGMFYDESVYSSRSLYEVKTRKILSYSNTMASASNIIYCAITQNWNKLDIGGLIVTLYRLVTDYKFIKEIKFEFLEKEFYNKVMGQDFDF